MGSDQSRWWSRRTWNSLPPMNTSKIHLRVQHSHWKLTANWQKVPCTTEAMRKTPEDWVRSEKTRSCKDRCLWEGSWRKQRYSGRISALCGEQAEPHMRCPATEPDAGKMSPRGWLEGSGKNRTAVGSWHSPVRARAHWLAAEMGQRGQAESRSRSCPGFCDCHHTLQPHFTSQLHAGERTAQTESTAAPQDTLKASE